MTIFLALWVCKSIQLNAVTIFFRKDDTSQQQAGNPPAYNLQHRMIHNPNKPTKMIKIVMLMLYLIIPTEARGSVSKKQDRLMDGSAKILRAELKDNRIQRMMTHCAIQITKQISKRSINIPDPVRKILQNDQLFRTEASCL